MPFTITHLLGTTTPSQPLVPLPMWDGNLLRGRPPRETTAPDQPLVCWSGWIEPQPQGSQEEPGATALPDFHARLRTWGPEAWDQMLAACGALQTQTQPPQNRPAPILLRPHARHVISDAQRCVRFLEAIAASTPAGTPACGLLLDPAAMLTPDMLPDAAEHLDRMLTGLAAAAQAGIGGDQGLWGLLLTGLEPGPGGELAACPITRGVLPSEVLLAAAEGWAGGAGGAGEAGGAGPGRVVILGDDAAAQLELLRQWGR